MGLLQVKQPIEEQIVMAGAPPGSRQSGVGIKKDEVVKLQGQHRI